MYINKYSQQFDYMLICLKRVFLFVGVRADFCWCCQWWTAAPLNLLRFFVLFLFFLFFLKPTTFRLRSGSEKLFLSFLSLKHMKFNEKQLRILNFFIILQLSSVYFFFGFVCQNVFWLILRTRFRWDSWAKRKATACLTVELKLFSDSMLPLPYDFNNFPFMHMSIIACSAAIIS